MMVVLVFPVADHDLRVQQRVEAVDVEALVAEPAVERLNVPVPPRRARWDVGQAGAGTCPVGHRFADELRPLSDLSTTGAPRTATRSSRYAVSRSAVIDRSTSPPMHSRVCSSTIEQILIGRPVRRRRTGSPPPAPRSARPLLRGRRSRADAFATPLLPDAEASSRQRRWIFLWFTTQPSARAS